MKKMYFFMLFTLCLGVFQPVAAQSPQTPLSFDELNNYAYVTSMQDAMQNPENVIKLWLRVDGSTSLPADIKKFQNVQMISLTGNLRKLDWKKTVADLSKFKNLRYVFLFDSFMTVIPADIFTMKQLRGFGLSNAALKKLPPTIGLLTNLEYLFLDDNNLTTLPIEIAQLKKLKMLVLDYNDITAFPVQMATMKNLKELRIVETPIKPEELKKIKKALPNLKIVEDYGTGIVTE